MNKTERDELRRLLRARFKLLRTDVAARQAELETELEAQIEAEFAAGDRTYDELMYKLKLAVDEANRVANDIGRELWGLEKWGVKTEKQIVTAQDIPRPGKNERWQRKNQGRIEIERQVRAALHELERQENELLTELATSALQSTEAQAFFARIPSVSQLIPAYRLKEITE